MDHICIDQFLFTDPPYSKIKLNFSAFLDEFTSLLEDVMLSMGTLIHTIFKWTVLNTQIQRCSTIFWKHLVLQHVQVSTHSSGRTLDLLITKAYKIPFSELQVTEPLISDHQSLLANCFILIPANLNYPEKKLLILPVS